jgi:hypothetical protein
MFVFNLLDILQNLNKPLVEFRPYAGYFLVLYGFAECYFASRFYRYFMALTGYLLILIAGYWVPVEWIDMALVRHLIITLIGIGIGMLFYFNRFVRIAIKGVIILLVLGTVFLQLFNVTPNNTLLVGLGIVGGLIFLVADRGTRIVGLSMFGAFLFIYGCFLSWGWKVFQDMSFVFDAADFDIRLPGLLLGWAVLFATGVIVQTKLTS